MNILIKTTLTCKIAGELVEVRLVVIVAIMDTQHLICMGERCVQKEQFLQELEILVLIK